MTFEEYAAELSKIDPSGSNPGVDWKKLTRLWVQLEKKAERLVSSIAPGAACTAQEWDHRIDCTIILGDGAVVGEMIGLNEISEQRLRETGDRLKRRREGEKVALVNQLGPPVLIHRP
ncbi:hypothetical protein [Iodidimonas sp. SYSU 1G8]|uniref:hypothetical protein n=1 Tax=Iodidimonas sp. SYSU 1G8 TaxID=3133967 RepID=UPI0031FEA03D